MAAPTGNRFWTHRTKHGRDKLFETPEVLWEAACEYFLWCEDNPLMESEQAKGILKPVKNEETGQMIFPPNLIELPKMRAFTWEGLELYLDVDSLKHYQSNEAYKDFFPIISRIGKIIYNQKFTGAAAGFLNPNIIARDLGLREKLEHSGGINMGADEYEIGKRDE